MRSLLFFLTIPLICFSIGSSADQLVVIASSSEQFSPGAVVDASREIVLPTNVSVTLISSDGGTITLNGPYKGKPNRGGSNSNKSFIDVLSEIASKEASSGIAVFRNSPGSRPDLWAININKPGTYCVQDGAEAILWSNRVGSSAKLHITSVGDPGDVTDIDWPGGARTVDWPDSLSLKDGSSYGLQLAGVSREIKVRIIPASLTTDAHRAVWMWNNGCEKQARRVVRALANGG